MVRVEDFLVRAEPSVVARVLPQPRKEIRWVASTELRDPGEFLEGSELVLTTGLIAQGWQRDEWSRYVASLAKAGASALGFGAGIAYESIPTGLFEACEVHELNLLEIGADVTFVSISRQVADMVMQPGQAATPQEQSGLMIQQELSRAAAKGSEVAILRALASIFRGAAAVHDQSGAVQHGPVGPGRTFPLADIQREIDTLAGRGRPGAVGVYEGGRHLSLVPLGLGGTVRGFLSLTYPERPSPWQRSALSLAVSLLGVAAETERERRGARSQWSQLLARLLVQGECSAAGIVAAECGMSPPDQLQVAVILGASLEVAESFAQELLWFHDEGMLILVGTPGVIEDLPGVLLRGRRIGVGSVQEAMNADTSYREARLAAERATDAAPRVLWRDLAKLSLGGLLPPAVGREFATRQLDAIMGDPRLIETLVAFLQAGGSTAAMGRAMALHRNSVSNRLLRLRAALGVDLDDPSVRAHLWIAVELLGLDAAPTIVE